MRILFPAQNRNSKIVRWINITLRSIHLIGCAGIGGGYLYGAPRDAWYSFLLLTIISGIMLILLELYSNGIWLIQLRGIAIIIKLILLICIPYFNGSESYILITVIVISGIMAHAPGDVRYFSVIHGRRMDTLV